MADVSDPAMCRGRWCTETATIRFTCGDPAKDKLYCDAHAAMLYADLTTGHRIGPILDRTSVFKSDKDGRDAESKAAGHDRKRLYANLGKPMKCVDWTVNYDAYEDWSRVAQTRVDKWMHDLAIARALKGLHGK